MCRAGGIGLACVFAKVRASTTHLSMASMVSCLCPPAFALHQA
ncbi:hypothetical protein P368_00290 [Comamonas thiooxydans]|nr:hypothetical protein P369_00285 [Comamonas thiooxydans]KGH02505.1 hypothetical protein P367_00290 [Comamonas thiooxydans]KGH09719.1 hypothetical protein P365_00290 [Comamonas thiooxydans]KGH16170.1 hypothetical protein P368_00290 [Comamonas thiooxydans]